MSVCPDCGFPFGGSHPETYCGSDPSSSSSGSVKIVKDDVTLGGVIGSIDDHEISSGPFKGWKPFGLFEITSAPFHEQLARFPTTKGELIQNRYARALSVTEDVYGYVSSVMIVYRHDHTYHMGMLFDPEWDAKFSKL